MTPSKNAQLAGVTLLLYIIVGVSQMTVFGGTSAGDTVAARLATMAQQASVVRINALLTLVTAFVAMLLGVTFYALTREEDADLASFALVCRVAEGVLAAMSIPFALGLLSLASSPTSTTGADAVGTFVFGMRRAVPLVSAMLFAVGSLTFAWLLLRARSIPVSLAWLGVVASALLVVALPMQLVGLVRGAVVQLIWLPMLAFEVPLALWLIVKGLNPRPLPSGSRVAVGGV